MKNHKACCKGYTISESTLTQAVLDILHLYINDLSNPRQVLDFLKQLPAKQNGSEELSQKLRHIEESLKKYRRLVSSLHEDYHDGLLSKEEYLDLKAAYGEQISELTDALENITNRRNELINSFTKISTYVEQFHNYLKTPSLERRMLVSMVKRIYIYPKNRVHIIFRFSDEFKNFSNVSPDDSSLTDSTKNLVGKDAVD